ncbi:MAG: hypothetical protein A3F83_07125 [Candidatus Glassbacteria bacterium RIFCSPLOWO2_12_FULL_58_11]|uniref:PglD N-terminal domain-containing protein n=1 Tax=Candidatus Glassbacteria bacterium RIFCSPLOWO2_12_FULL_58_11 TaxID=1817867 RepID=A0A1F5YS69_9BACT|nr:MAG: hypothetical protein A3F83_07125 [Candidatus Glassbacteria bacterium RIFCSPLOWO2_12_FULL_58_11]
MEKLILIGAGGMCREVISLVEDINSLTDRFEIRGILDDNPSLAGEKVAGHTVLGPITSENIPEDCQAALCIATHRDIALRGRVGERLNLSPERWAKIIHPQATISSSARIEPGAILYAGSRVGPDTSIGLNSFLYYNAVLHHDSHLGDYTQVCAGVLIAGYVTVGNRCYLGIGSILRDNIAVADDIMVGMGAVATQDLREPGKVYRGMPARAI